MKPVKPSQTKLKELTSIKILDNSYKLDKLHYSINDKDWFEFIGVRFENNKKFITLGLLKTIAGVSPRSGPAPQVLHKMRNLLMKL